MGLGMRAEGLEMSSRDVLGDIDSNLRSLVHDHGGGVTVLHHIS